jgi:serine/threonine protein kinase
MLRLNPHSRYSAKECLEHDFFQVTFNEEELLPHSIIDKKSKLDQGEDYVVKKMKYV